MDVCLAFILLIFTAGIGFIIYLIYYYSKPENRCIHCGTVIEPALVSQAAREQLPYQKENQVIPPSLEKSYKAEPSYVPIESTARSTALIYCPLCGAKLSSEHQRFCPNCGSKLN